MHTWIRRSLSCLIVLMSTRAVLAQPIENKKDTAIRTVTGPSDFFKKKEAPKADPTPTVSVAMPRVQYYKLEKGNQENMPPGFYASFEPSLPDTVKVYEGGTDDFVTINTKAGKEIIHGDSVAVLFEIDTRKALYVGNQPIKKGKTTSLITRSGFIPSQGFGTNRYRFAVTPSKFRIAPGALIQASVHILGSEKNMGTILCSVSSVDYEHNTFYVETSNEVPAGEHINWIIMNFPE